jgi:hypothetical protein
MILDVVEEDHVALACNGVDDAAPRRVDAQGRQFELMVRVLLRDDPLRRFYVRRRWQTQPTSIPRYKFECASFPAFVLRRR